MQAKASSYRGYIVILSSLLVAIFNFLLDRCPWPQMQSEFRKTGKPYNGCYIRSIPQHQFRVFEIFMRKNSEGCPFRDFVDYVYRLFVKRSAILEFLALCGCVRLLESKVRTSGSTVVCLQHFLYTCTVRQVTLSQALK